MTTKEKFDKILFDRRQFIKKIIFIWFIVIASMVFLGYVNLKIFQHKTAETIFSIIALTAWLSIPFGFILYFYLRQSIKNFFLCPKCKTDLSYCVLTTDNFYNRVDFSLPEVFPYDVTHCPNCKFDLNSEENDDQFRGE